MQSISGDFNQFGGSSAPVLVSISSSSPLIMASNMAPNVSTPSTSNDASERVENPEKEKESQDQDPFAQKKEQKNLLYGKNSGKLRLMVLRKQSVCTVDEAAHKFYESAPPAAKKAIFKAQTVVKKASLIAPDLAEEAAGKKTDAGSSSCSESDEE